MTRAGLALPLWLRLTRHDDAATSKTTVTGLYSMDGVAWTVLDAAEFSIPDPALAGIIFTSGSLTNYANALVTGFSVSTAPLALPAGAGSDGGSDGAP